MKKNRYTLWEYIHANPKKMLFWVGVVYFIFWILFDDFGLVKRVRMEADHIRLLERQKVEQKKIIDNELRIRHARDPDSIEKAARERYNFRKPGETLFIIKGK
ncbi:MAG: septum formation initiator family protein [Chlorobiaceae bacterium]